eukprot:scaffold283923_cov22-Tisochrysis_lutea.AAC.1
MPLPDSEYPRRGCSAMGSLPMPASAVVAYRCQGWSREAPPAIAALAGGAFGRTLVGPATAARAREATSGVQRALPALPSGPLASPQPPWLARWLLPQEAPAQPGEPPQQQPLRLWLETRAVGSPPCDDLRQPGEAFVRSPAAAPLPPLPVQPFRAPLESPLHYPPAPPRQRRVAHVGL